VCLYHSLGWPDHGVPANAISMINFIKRVRKSHPYSKKAHLLVHCSAGVGRTGTFITLDYMLERIKSEKSINIYQFVSSLRKQRVLMVQTLVSVGSDSMGCYICIFYLVYGIFVKKSNMVTFLAFAGFHTDRKGTGHSQDRKMLNKETQTISHLK